MPVDRSSSLTTLLRPARWTAWSFMLAWSSLAAQGPSPVPTRGTRFWTGFMQNGFGAQNLRVHVMGTTATSGTVSLPLTGWSTSFTVAANGAALIEVPISAENFGSGTVQNKGVLIEADDSVNVFVSSFQNFTHDQTQVLPENALGNAYRIDSYQGLPNFNNLHKSELLVIASQDGTEIRITPSVPTASGQPAGIPFIVPLQAGQTYQLQAAQDIMDLSGTLVEATEASGNCRPFAVLGGSMCATAPGSCSACDAIFEQLMPINTWGLRYFTVPVHGVTSSTYRVMAHEDNTVVTIGGGAPIMLNAGQRHEVSGTNSPVCIEANKPVSAIQLLEGYSCAGNGDPSLLILSPAERKSTSALLHTPSSPQINAHSISIVVDAAAIGQVTLNGIPVNPSLFQPYAGCSDRYHAKLGIPAGIHRVQASSGFQLYSFGIGFGESYASSVNDIGTVALAQDSAICGTGPVTLSPPIPLVNATWTTASDPNSVYATGNTITVTPVSSESYTVSGEQSTSGCPRSFTYHIGVPLTVPTLLTANGFPSPTICQYQPVQLGLQPPPDPAWFTIQWGPATTLNDPAISDPLATPLEDTWYTVSITSPSGCGDLIDSIFVGVTQAEVLAFDLQPGQVALCAGASTQLTSTTLRVIARDRFNGPAGGMWAAIQGGTVSAACGSYTGTALYFNGNGQRSAQTMGLNTLGGGELRFHLKIANAIAPCDDADPGEDVRLEYSTNNGFSWQSLSLFAENAYAAFTPIVVPIPLAAQTTNTMFRLRQISNSGSGQDNWAVDDMTIARYDNGWLDYTWSPSSVASPNAPTTAITPAASSWYVLQGVDPQSGCTYLDSTWVQVAPALTVTVTNDTTLCNIAGLQLQAIPNLSTPVTYAWAPVDGTLSDPASPTPVATPQTTTTYTVTATSVDGCTANGQVLVTVGQLLGLQVTATDSILCQGQSTLLNASAIGPALTYTWSGAGLSATNTSDPTATPSQTTTYTCTVTDPVSGCALNGSITITVNTGYTADAGPDLTLCSTLGHQLSVQHNVPNATYQWSPAGNLNSAVIQSPTILVDASGTYTVTITDPNGCSVSDVISLTRALEGLPASQSTSSCANTPPQLDAPQSGSSYLWSTGQTTPSIVPPASGNYTLTITDAQGCQGITTFNVTLFPMPVADLGPDIDVCGTTAQQLATGAPGNSFLWSTGAASQQITVSSSGTYGVTVTSMNGCSTSDTITIQFHPLPIDVLQDVTACIATPPILDAGNTGSTYAWSTGASTSSLTASASGTYSVTVTTPQNCSATFSAEVVLMPLVQIDLGSDITLCSGQSATLDPGGTANSFSWNTGATTQAITVNTSGTYSVTATNGYCSATDALTVSMAPSPSDQLQDLTACNDQNVTLNAGNPGSSYSWNTGASDQSIIVNTSGLYSVVVTAANGCSATFAANVQFIAPPEVYLGADTVLCDGNVLVLDALNPGAVYSWNTGASSPTISVSEPGTYTVVVDNGYCERSDSVMVLFNPSPEQLATRLAYICLDDDPGFIMLDAGNPGASYLWSTGQTTQTLRAETYGWYAVEITNTFACSISDSIQVVEDCPSTFYAPNTFTPDGDGMNDVFIPVGKNIAFMELLIFDRWGNLLFESRDPSIGWDGRYRGEVVKNDIYVWKARFRFVQRSVGRPSMEQEQMGHIQVLR